MSFWQLFMHAGLLVKAIMLLLLAMSVVSWAFIFQNRKLLKATEGYSATFEEDYADKIELINLYDKFRGAKRLGGTACVFIAAMKDFMQMKGTGVPKNEAPEHIERAMRVAIMRERERLSQNINWLATIGSVSPYIGLFGTVWGIMHAFISLGGVQQATLAMVAPGIAEALVATAMGLFAAIPAVVAYNRFSSQINRLTQRYQTFGEDLLNTMSKKIYAQ